jgi:hypothetical protein
MEKINEPKRIGRPPKRPTPNLSFEAVLKIRDVMLKAVHEAPEEIKLKREMSFQDVVEELHEAVGRFFSTGYGLSDGVRVIQELNLNLTDAEIKSVLLQANLRHEDTAAPA